MGGRVAFRAALLFMPSLLVAGDPVPAEVRVPGPEGGHVLLRVAFKKGVQVSRDHLPEGFLKKASSAHWLTFEELNAEGKRWVLRALFPEDEWQNGEVQHRVRWPELESVWLMASLFSGHGQNYDQLQDANPKNSEKLRKGDLWRVPKNVVSVELGGTAKGVLVRTQPEDEFDDEHRIAAYRGLLSFEDGPDGKVAVYRMRKGEALYSSVVMRYTDRVDPKDVNDLALELARRAGIEDVRSIQPGQLIRIPITHLADPFQPEGSVALKEEREVRDEVRRTVRVDAGPRLKGVRIVLDAGHGGVDPGAQANGVWEADYVYDICMRLRALLQDNTDAQISSTIRYPTFGFNVRDRIEAPARSAEILTTPPFVNDGESPNAVSVHLRWVLANDLFASFAKKTGDVQKTLFISFHADALHPSARGTMLYVPGASAVPESFSLSPSRTLHVAETRSAKVKFTAKERLRSEARSRLFSESVLKAFKRGKIPVHDDRPIRNVIHRSGKSFIPAVIRYSAASTKVLIEVANLTNDQDAENLKTAAFRQRYAEALVKAIRAYYGK